jgi:hypothetical protein
MTTALKILVIGGYGVFGGRIIELLDSEARFMLLVAGRSLAKANRFIASRSAAKTNLHPAVFDRDGDIDAQLASIAPDIVVDASGPFQNYGGRPYRVIEACLRHRINYLDLADGSDFVAGVSAFDAKAREAGIFILSGVSSFPVLTAAAVRALSHDMSTVTAIRGGIAPSPYAVVGENVIRAIASYAGQPVQRTHNGAVSAGYPFTEQLRYTIAPPGYVPLEPRLFSLVDVPDLRALAVLWPQAKEIWMGAAPVPELLHRCLMAFAWLVRRRLIPTLAPLAPLFHFFTNHVRWGQHRGGMFVEVEGLSAYGRPAKRSWHLLADGDDGPYIPAMAVEAIVRNTLAGRAPLPGARASVRDLELDDYAKVFAGRAIYTGMRDDLADQAKPLYQRLLSEAYADLPGPIRAMHDLSATAAAEGRARVERGRNPLARIAAACIGFPQENPDTPVRVDFTVADGKETWRRTFGDESFASRQFAGGGSSDGLLCEQFGPCRFGIALVIDDKRLVLVMRRWSVFGIPLPLWLCPRTQTYESAEDGRFNFHVKISHPLTGPIVSYDGWLEPVA